MLSVLFTAIISEFLQGTSLPQKAMFYALFIFAMIGLLSILGSVRGWRFLSVYSLIMPCSKMSELDNQWDKVTRRVTDLVFSLPKTTRFFPEAWFHKNIEHRNIQIFSRSIENLNFLKDKLGTIINIEESRESIFRHFFRGFGRGNTNMYRCNNYRRYVAKLDWEDLRKKITPLKLELTERCKTTEIKTEKKDLKKESYLDLEARLKHGYLTLSMVFDDSSNIHMFFHYFEAPSRQVADCMDTMSENWKMIVNSLDEILGDKYVEKEKAGSEISDEMINGERYLVMHSWGKTLELLAKGID